jgi:hypothetical protein
MPKQSRNKGLTIDPLSVNQIAGAMLSTPPIKKKAFSLFGSEAYWGELPFPKEEMDGKRVSFDIMVEWEKIGVPTPTSGTGKFLIRKSKRGFHVEIVCRISPQNEKVINLTSDMTKLIKLGSENPNCQFSLKFQR